MILLLRGFTVMFIITLGASSSSSSAAAASSDPNITMSETCKINPTAECGTDFLQQILNISAEELHQETVEMYLTTIMTLMTSLRKTITDEEDLIWFGDSVLKASEKLVSTLLRKTETFNLTSIILQMLEVQMFQVGWGGAETYWTEVLHLQLSNISMDIHLSELLDQNNGSAAVGFISYSNMKEFLKPSLFRTTAHTKNIMMSRVVSVVLPQTFISTQLTGGVNVTFEHDDVFKSDSRYCVSWNSSGWVDRGCNVTVTNRTHTECSCSHPSTFALIEQTEIYVALKFLKLSSNVGLVFLCLALLTFAVCRDPKENKVALVNLSLSILFSKLFRRMPDSLSNLLYSNKILGAVMTGLDDCIYLSFYMWMFLEAVVLCILVTNLSKIGSDRREVPNWKWLVLFGYGTPAVVVFLTAVISPCEGEAWCVESMFTSYYVHPINALISMSTIFFISIIVQLIITLKRLNSSDVQVNNTLDKGLMISVVLKGLAQFIILGCPYAMSVFAVRNDGFVYYLISQQGTFIFFVHCIFNQKIREKYKNILLACFQFLRSSVTGGV